MTRWASCGSLSAFVVIGTSIGAETGGGMEQVAKQPQAKVSAIGGSQAELDDAVQRHGLTFGVDAALYDQGASETQTGSPNLGPGAGERSETLIEAYYRFAISSKLSLTSDVQLVLDPAMDSAAENSVLLGLRLHLRL